MPKTTTPKSFVDKNPIIYFPVSNLNGLSKEQRAMLELQIMLGIDWAEIMKHLIAYAITFVPLAICLFCCMCSYLTAFTRNLRDHVGIVCAFTSICLNLVLTYLILVKSPKKLGVYKYLMCYISLFEVFYSIWDMMTEPIVHSYKAAFVVLRDYNGSVFDREVSFVLVCIYCGLFGFSMAIFGVHFIYRYGAVNKSFSERFLPGNWVYMLFAIPLWYGTWWAVLCYIYFYYTDITDAYMKETIEYHYGIPIKDSSYIIVYFQPTGADGKPHPDPKIFFAIGCMWYMIISSMFSVFYFGIRCYWQIRKTINQSAAVSATTKNLQTQLFHALVVQTFIPLVLMYIPIGILFFFPMVIWELPFTTEFVGYTIALYPAIDPLPNMIIIKFYRHAIQGFFMKIFGRGKRGETQHSLNTVDAQSGSVVQPGRSAGTRFV